MMEYSASDGEEPSLSTKPYLIRAIYQWALDNGYTPQILVATDNEKVVVPRQYVQDDRIVLNIHPQSVAGLNLGNEYIWLSTRFSGKAMEITVPLPAVLAIYARENGQGVVFHDNDTDIISSPPDSPATKQSGAKKTKLEQAKKQTLHLKLVE